MKPIISAIALAGLFAMTACNRTTSIAQQESAMQQHKIDSLNTELAKKKVIDSMSDMARLQNFSMLPGAAQGAQPARVVYVNRGATRGYAGRSRGSAASSSGRYYNNSVAQAPMYQQAPARKRGWSAKAKGAVIGAGTGAVAGAIINRRNRLAGGVIGGVLGAGVGTGIGAILDKRNGR